MIDAAQETDTYVADFARFERAGAEGAQAWLLPIRKAALARFAELGFPTTRDEEWRYTNVAPIAKARFLLADQDGAQVASRDIRPFTLGEAGGSQLVFVNGRHAPRLSSVRPLPSGVKVVSLAAALESDRRLVEPHLARRASDQDHAFAALNAAFMQDGAFIHVPKGSIVEEPIHLLFVSTAGGQPRVSHPYNLIIADVDSQATVIESYVGPDSGVYFTNGVTEIVAGENAVIDHYKVQREGEQAFHVGRLQLRQLRSSNVRSHTISLGGVLVRNDIHAVLGAEGCDCTLNGLYMLRGEQHVDNHLLVEHAKPHCNSREFFKGVLDGRSRGVFSGRIIVHPDAQKTDAKQTNMNLLLSEDALVDTKPQLEIFADDVKCTHGATIGQVDDDAIFYLRSRGISKPAARNLLICAFAGESLARVRCEPLRTRLASVVSERWSQGQPFPEAV